MNPPWGPSAGTFRGTTLPTALRFQRFRHCAYLFKPLAAGSTDAGIMRNAAPTDTPPAPPGSPHPERAGAIRSSIASFTRTAVAREPGLVTVGVGGLLLAVVCMIGVAFRGRHIPPEGKLLDAATFTFGVGVYTLTVALLLPVAGYSATTRRRWRRAYYLFAVYGLLLETVQAFRGLDPRFTEEGETIDSIAGAVFGVTAGITLVLFVLLGVQIFRRGVLDDRPVLRLGVRYGVIAVAISFGVGVVMSVTGGRRIGADGNLLLAHGLGVHGLQTLPLVALVVSASALTRRRRWVHIAGVAWLAACLAALLQAGLGDPPLQTSALSIAIVTGLVGWAAVAAYAVALRARDADSQPSLLRS